MKDHWRHGTFNSVTKKEVHIGFLPKSDGFLAALECRRAVDKAAQFQMESPFSEPHWDSDRVNPQSGFSRHLL